MNSLAKLTAAVTCGLVLTACGGGGGDDTATNTNGGSDSSNSSGQPAFRYEAQTPATNPTDFLTQLNQEGARGYRYLEDAFFDGLNSGGISVAGFASDNALNFSTGFPATTGTPSFSAIFLNDGTAPTYTYTLLVDPDDTATLITQANTEGASGYAYQGRVQFATDGNTGQTAVYSLYGKAGGSAATYTYVADPVPDNTADFLTQANGRGQSGYQLFHGSFHGDFNDSTAPASNLYRKDNTSNATYAYDALTPVYVGVPGTSQASLNAAVLAQLNSEGAKGYRATQSMQLNSDTTVMLYVKDLAQTATLTYQFDTQQATSAAFIAQANSYGTQDYEYWGYFGFADEIVSCPASGCYVTAVGALYFKTSN